MIADRVRGWLAENHKDQQWLANTLGLHRSTVSLSMNGKRDWRPAEIHYIAEILGIQPDQLQQNSHSVTHKTESEDT